MKSHLVLILLVCVCIFTNAQNPPITQNNWYFTQLESGTNTIFQPIPFRNVGVTLSVGNTGTFDTYAFNDINGTLVLDPTMNTFSITNSVATLSFSNDPAIDDFDFKYRQFFLDFINQPYSYTVTTLGNLTSLRITNPMGDVAEYQNVPLSETTTELSGIHLYVSQNIRQIQITSQEIPLNQLELVLFDLNGRSVLTLNKIEHPTINLSGLKKGLYIVRVKDATGVFNVYKISI